MQLPCLLVWHHISKEIVWRISYMVYFQGYHKIAHGLLTGGIPVNKSEYLVRVTIGDPRYQQNKHIFQLQSITNFGSSPTRSPKQAQVHKNVKVCLLPTYTELETQLQVLDITNKILNEHPGKKDQNTIARWNALFRYACLMEIEFFKQGLDTVVRIALSSSSSTSHVGERARGKQHAVIQNMMPSDPIPSL